MRVSRKAVALLAAVAGVVLFVGFSRYFLGVDLGTSLEYLRGLPAVVVVLAVVARSACPALHSTQLFLVLRLLGVRLGFKRVLLGVYSTLALEYLVPIGGATEVGRVAILVSEGVPPARAVESVFLHRLLHSFSAAVELALLLLVGIGGGVMWVLTAAVIAVNVLNLAVLASSRSQKIRKLFSGVLPKLGVFPEYPIHVKSPKLTYIAMAALAVGLEKAASILSGYLILRCFEPSAGLADSMLLFDLLLVIFWLLPIVTPAGVGQVEAAQLATSVVVGLEKNAVFAAAVLYRIVTTLSILPQLLAGFFMYGASRLGEVISKARV
jgi:uncharacterized membrane protein YbhN (UPF0104 family)